MFIFRKIEILWRGRSFPVGLASGIQSGVGGLPAAGPALRIEKG